MAFNVMEPEWDAELAGDLPERRWFALSSAVKKMQSECAILLEASKLADAAWRRACVQLAEFEALRDAFEEEMSGKSAAPPSRHPPIRFESRSEFLSAGTR